MGPIWGRMEFGVRKENKLNYLNSGRTFGFILVAMKKVLKTVYV